MRPKRTDDKYWTGTRCFNHIQYESDLEDYIIDLENETQKLHKQLFCDECGDTGRTYPTLAEPDGVECENCKAN